MAFRTRVFYFLTESGFQALKEKNRRQKYDPISNSAALLFYFLKHAGETSTVQREGWHWMIYQSTLAQHAPVET